MSNKYVWMAKIVEDVEQVPVGKEHDLVVQSSNNTLWRAEDGKWAQIIGGEAILANLGDVDASEKGLGKILAVREDGKHEYIDIPDGSVWEPDGEEHIKPKDNKKVKIENIDASFNLADLDDVDKTAKDTGKILQVREDGKHEYIDIPDGSVWEPDGEGYIKPKDSKKVKIENIDVSLNLSDLDDVDASQKEAGTILKVREDGKHEYTNLEDFNTFAKIDGSNQPFTGDIGTSNGCINIGSLQSSYAINVEKDNDATLNLDYLPDTAGMCDLNTRRMYNYDGSSLDEQPSCGNNYNSAFVYSGVSLSSEQAKFGAKSMKIVANGYIGISTWDHITQTQKRYAKYDSGQISFWLYIPEGTPTFNLYFYTGVTHTYYDNSNGHIRLNWSADGNSSLTIYNIFTAGVIQNYTINDGTITAGEWHHFAFNTNNSFSYYRDGSLISSGTAPLTCTWVTVRGVKGVQAPQWFKTSQLIYIDDFLWYGQNTYTLPTYEVPTKPNGPALGKPKVLFQVGGTPKGEICVDGFDGDKLKIKTTDTTRITVVPETGNVGIGTEAPSEKLNVGGNILASGTVGGSNLSGTNTGDQSSSDFNLSDLGDVVKIIETNTNEITPNGNKTETEIYISALAQAFTLKNPSGSPVNGNKITVQITATEGEGNRDLTWGNGYRELFTELPEQVLDGGTIMVEFCYFNSIWNVIKVLSE